MRTKRLLSVIMLILIAASAVCGAAYAENAPLRTFDESISDMLPVLDSVARAIIEGDTSGYAPSDHAFFWETMYLCGANWSDVHPSAGYGSINGEKCSSLQRGAMHQFAEAAFFDYESLPPLEGDYGINYDPSTNSYLFMPSDPSDIQFAIDTYALLENGNIYLTATMNSDAGAAYRLEYTLAPRDTVSIDPGAFMWRIMSANIIKDD